MASLSLLRTSDRFLYSTWDTGQVYRGSAPAVHLLAQGAVTVGARTLRGYEPAGCHDPGGGGAAVGERGAEAVPRQAGDAGRTVLVPKEGGSCYHHLPVVLQSLATTANPLRVLGWRRTVRPVCLSTLCAASRSTRLYRSMLSIEELGLLGHWAARLV